MNQTQLCAHIIRNNLPWRPVDSAGNPVKKPEGDDLELLLKCHKSGVTIQAGTSNGLPGLPFGGHDTSPENPERWDMTPEETHPEKSVSEISFAE